MTSSEAGPEHEISRSGGSCRVLLSSVSSDSHTWNLVYLQLLLEELGHEVHNIGACVPDELLIAECRRLTPDLVVVSTVNGHGAADGGRLIRRLRAQEDMLRLPVVIGGTFGTRAAAAGTYAPELLAAGFTAVFENGSGIRDFCHYVGTVVMDASLAAGSR
ncbi:cobalamin B12-binding domain-containing protein (plasmid) [Streptomyces sp. NBC_01591]|uniref:cobalamin B12-binding domain-containing protein n=1 Tax=Streptomyces sp. NBC_01591 TaxID=2975888 RepID=UPI002DDA1450|nr:cobalamin B12-binding domain-containing protein [Streptomyces sp. NBC_01591]WSD73896.1 cobalamin B12-binding domain-containing protein [Streptomyces sp. NBC_01591]